jgi:hypothetical protein
MGHNNLLRKSARLKRLYRLSEMVLKMIIKNFVVRLLIIIVVIMIIKFLISKFINWIAFISLYK